jgi:hypothetical protein
LEDALVAKAAPRNYILHSKGPNPIIPSSKYNNIPLRKITPPLYTLKPNVPTQGKINDKFDKAIPSKTDKPSTSNLARNNTKLNTLVNNKKTCEQE